MNERASAKHLTDAELYERDLIEEAASWVLADGYVLDPDDPETRRYFAEEEYASYGPEYVEAAREDARPRVARPRDPDERSPMTPNITEQRLVARTVSELREYLLAPGLLEHALAMKHDADGRRLARLDLPAEVRRQLEGSRPPAPSADDERAFLGDLLRQIEVPPSALAARAALPYLGRALRCKEKAQEVEGTEEAAWLVDDLLQALGWAADAQEAAAGNMPVADYEAGQERERDLGLFLRGDGRGARHPQLVKKGAKSSFRWHHWARAICERGYLSRAAKQLAPLLAMFADASTGRAWPSQGQLAELSGITTRSIRDALHELEGDLSLVVEEKARGRRHQTYRLLPVMLDPMETRIAEDGREDGEAPVPF
jgi:hypothetical protein